MGGGGYNSGGGGGYNGKDPVNDPHLQIVLLYSM